MVSRLAAAKALSCIAIQCQEPYRIQIYGVFKGCIQSDDTDLFGLSNSISQVLDILDRIYAGQIMIDQCVAQWGGHFDSWPPELADAVRQRHQQLLDVIVQHCQVPTDVFFPLGPKSRALILGEDVPMTIDRQTSVGFEPPQAQYSDYLRQGSVYIDEGYEMERSEDVNDDEGPSTHKEEDQVDLFLRASNRTRQYLEGKRLMRGDWDVGVFVAPSLKEIVDQSPEAAAYVIEQRPSYASESQGGNQTLSRCMMVDV